MKTRGNLLSALSVIFCLLFLSAASLSSAAIDFTNENNYCIVPPFIAAPTTPNLLLMLDNSASMYDLEYIDTSATSLFCFDSTFNKSNVCSSAGTNCTSNAGCPALETC